MHMAATWNQAQAASFLSALEVEQQLRLVSATHAPYSAQYAQVRYC